MINEKIIKSLFRQKRFQDITELIGINILPEKSENKGTINKIFRNNCVEISLNGYYWLKNDCKNYHKIKAVCVIKKPVNNKLARKLLLKNLYKEVITRCLPNYFIML